MDTNFLMNVLYPGPFTTLGMIIKQIENGSGSFALPHYYASMVVVYLGDPSSYTETVGGLVIGEEERDGVRGSRLLVPSRRISISQGNPHCESVGHVNGPGMDLGGGPAYVVDASQCSRGYMILFTPKRLKIFDPWFLSMCVTLPEDRFPAFIAGYWIPLEHKFAALKKTVFDTATTMTAATINRYIRKTPVFYSIDVLPDAGEIENLPPNDGGRYDVRQIQLTNQTLKDNVWHGHSRGLPCIWIDGCPIINPYGSIVGVVVLHQDSQQLYAITGSNYFHPDHRSAHMFSGLDPDFTKRIKIKDSTDMWH